MATITLGHEAMATEFHATVVADDTGYARQAMAAAWHELDRLECALSRFRDDSDIARLNRLPTGGETSVGVDTFHCLQLADQLRRHTSGAFDVTYRSQTPAAPDQRLRLNPRGCRVRVLAAGVEIDLGGIGKGFALDRMAELLDQWDVRCALLAASSSTLVALDPPPGTTGWPVQVGPARDARHPQLARAAISGSGVARQGRHIFDPRSQRPATANASAWALAATGAESDAWSTALMVLSADEARGCLASHPIGGAWQLPNAEPSTRLVTLRSEQP